LSRRPLTFLPVLDVGTPVPLHSSALGKALLAFRPEAEREALLERLVAAGLPATTPATITDPAGLDPRQAEDFIVEYLEATQTDPVLLDAWKRLGMVVGFKIEDLGLGFGLDCTSGDKVVISRRYPDPPPAAAMKLTSDTFHDIFTGRRPEAHRPHAPEHQGLQGPPGREGA